MEPSDQGEFVPKVVTRHKDLGSVSDSDGSGRPLEQSLD